MTDFQALTIESLCERICENKKTLIVYHVRSDADAVGSAFALRELLRVLGIQAICACADEIPERLRFLSDGVQGSVLIEDDMGLDHERVISVDSASPEQLGSLFERLRRDVDLMIDHHAKGRIYADHYVDADACATGEIIYAMAKHLLATGRIASIPARVIHSVYAAMASDTGCFRYANTTPRALRTAAELLEAGADRDRINRCLFESKSEAQLRAEGEAARRLLLHDGGKIASVTFPYSLKQELGIATEDMETVIDIPRSVAGVEVAFVVRQNEEGGAFRVSMRSTDACDVSAVCAEFGGGGHKRAAGCSITAENIRRAEEMVLEAVRREASF